MRIRNLISSIRGGDGWRLFDYEDGSFVCYTYDEEEAWICIEFKNHEIRPTNYTIMSANDEENLKSFVIEGSKDKKTWTVIDEENDISYLIDSNSIHTFPIHNETEQASKYLRIRRTGPNWKNTNVLQLCLIEFYGELF